MTEQTFEVIFESDGTQWKSTAKSGETLLEVAQRCKAPVHTLCNGIGACVQCKVRVEADEDKLSEPTALEKDRMGNIFHLTRERLACQTCVLGPITVSPLKPKLPKKRKNLRVPTRRR